MSAISPAIAQQQLDAYLAAETAVLLNQSYEIAGRKLTRANLKDIQEGIELWSQRLTTAQAQAAGRGRTRTIVSR
jgi:hypothetical protein